MDNGFCFSNSPEYFCSEILVWNLVQLGELMKRLLPHLVIVLLFRPEKLGKEGREFLLNLYSIRVSKTMYYTIEDMKTKLRTTLLGYVLQRPMLSLLCVLSRFYHQLSIFCLSANLILLSDVRKLTRNNNVPVPKHCLVFYFCDLRP